MVLWDTGVPCIGPWGSGDADCSTSSVTDGNWHFIALTYETGQAQLYVDGALKVTRSGTYATMLTGTIDIGGTIVPSIPYAGLIDEVAIFNRALSANEIGAIYNAGSAGICAVKTIYLPLILRN